MRHSLFQVRRCTSTIKDHRKPCHSWTQTKLSFLLTLYKVFIVSNVTEYAECNLFVECLTKNKAIFPSILVPWVTVYISSTSICSALNKKCSCLYRHCGIYNITDWVCVCVNIHLWDYMTRSEISYFPCSLELFNSWHRSRCLHPLAPTPPLPPRFEMYGATFACGVTDLQWTRMTSWFMGALFSVPTANPKR